MNDYFNPPAGPVDFTTARGSAVKAIFAAVAAAFDKFPGIDALLQNRVNYAEAAGDGNTLTATYTRGPTAYVEGASFRLKLNATNSGAATLNVQALGAKQILQADGDALTGGELVEGNIQDFTYVGGAFRLPATGPQGPVGPIGPANGTQLLGGAADPVGGTGNNGDYFINRTSWKIFGPKAAGVWPAGVNIIGPAGANGANGANGTNGKTVLSGAGAPGGGTGVDGDFYVDVTAHAIYGPKAAGVWGGGTSLIGAAGAAGAPGVVDTTAAYDFTNAAGISTNGNELGFRKLPKSRSLAANFTLAAADNGKWIEYTDSADTCTVPLQASVAIPNDSLFTIVNNGTGVLHINREAGVTMKFAGSGANGNVNLSIGGYAWLHKINTNTWFVGGPGVS